MLDAVKVSVGSLMSMRTELKFNEIYQKAEDIIERLELEEIVQPRHRKIPKKIDDGSNNFKYSSAEEKYRAELYSVIDMGCEQLKYYFESEDMNQYKRLTEILLDGKYDAEICLMYPELNKSLEHEIIFFRTQFSNKFVSVDECRLLFKEFVPEVRQLFPQVEKLLRLLLVSPASSCEAERTFSALRRIKTWLRSTMTQQRLENVMMCHVHRDLLMDLDSKLIAKEFINDSYSNSTRDRRSYVFGSIK